MHILPTDDPTDAAGNVYAALFSGTTSIFALIFYVIVVIALWKVFTKAGHPGILAIIPIVNIVMAIIVAIKLGKNFGKGGVFSFFLLWLFSFIGYFIIGFGSAQYRRA